MPLNPDVIPWPLALPLIALAWGAWGLLELRAHRRRTRELLRSIDERQR